MKHLQKIFALFFLLLSSFAIAQQEDSLSKYSTEELIKKTYDAQYISNNKIYPYSKEILRRNPSDLIKSDAYVALAVYERDITGNIEKCIAYYEKCLTFKNEDNVIRQESVLAILAYVYAVNNEYDKALKCIREADKLDTKTYNKNYSTIYHLMGDFKKSIADDLKFIEGNKKYLKLHPEEKPDERQVRNESIYIGYANISSSYNYLHKLDSAVYFQKKFKLENKEFYANFCDGMWYVETFTLILKGEYDNAIARMKKSKIFINSSPSESYLANYYYAICYQKKKDYKKSLEYAETALQNIVVLQSFQNYELELYKIASKNAQQLGLTEKENYYLKKYNEGAQKINYQEKATFMANLYNLDVVKPLTEELIAKDKKSYYLWSGLAIVLILSASYIAYSIYKSKKDKKHFISIIEKLEREKYQNANLPEKIELESSEEIEEIEEKLPSKNSITISEETERKILKKLENFERKMQFLSPDVSLGKIAQDFKTNAYYITYVIKFHKNTNFNGYINKLRIDYITHKLKFNSEYTNYKIEYLAQESGFASYSTFKRIFTKETGIDPSKFISYLKEYN